MGMQGWRPLRTRAGQRSTEEEYVGPHDGVPDWLLAPLWAWIADHIDIPSPRFYQQGAIDEYRALAVALRMSLDHPAEPHPSTAHPLRDRLYEATLEDPELLLDVADYLLAKYASEPESALRRRELDQLLTAAGSAWTTRESPPRLERRVSTEEVAAMEGAAEASSRPGRHLTQAWRAAYGRVPDPTGAYREAVRAVEAAAQPVVSPRNDRATLGTMIRDMEAAPHNWEVVLNEAADGTSRLIEMMRLLWAGQLDRHGTPDETRPIAVSQEQAEAAVALAVTLVRWFVSGFVTRRGG